MNTDSQKLKDLLTVVITTHILPSAPSVAVIESTISSIRKSFTDIGECKRLAKGVGLVVDAGSSNSLAEAMISFIEDDSSYMKYITNCNVARDNYSWQKMVSVVDMVYKEIIMNE